VKEATGELNMTVVTIIAIGAVVGLFWFLWPTISDTIKNQFGATGSCPDGQQMVNGVCQ
jgi:hypothetical protein